MTSSHDDRPTGDLVRSLSDTVGALVREEIDRAREELAGTAHRAGAGAALLGGAAALGAMACGTTAVLLVRLLDRAVSPPAAAALATAVLGGGAAGLGAAGVARLRTAGPLTPRRTLQSVRDDVATARDAAGA